MTSASKPVDIASAPASAAQVPDAIGKSGTYAWYVASVLCCAHIIAFLDRYLIGLVSEPLRASFNISDTELGLLQGTGFVLLYTVAAIPLGFIADTTNRRNLIMIGIFVWSIATSAAAFCNSFGSLFLTRALVGVGEASLMPAALSLLAAYFVKSELGRGISIFGMGALLGKSVAFLGGGAVLSYFVIKGGLVVPGLGSFEPWQAVFLLAGILGMSVVLLVATIKEPKRAEVPLSERSSKLKSLFDGVKYMAANKRPYICQLVTVAAAATMGYTVTGWAASVFVRTYDLSVPQAGALVGTLVLFAGPTGNLAGGWFADRLVQKQVVGVPPLVIGVGILMSILPALMFCLAPGVALAAAGFALFQFSMTFVLPASYGGIQMLTPERYRGTAASVSLLVYTLCGMGFGPPVAGFLTDRVFADPEALSLGILSTLTILAVIGLVFAFGTREIFQRNIIE